MSSWLQLLLVAAAPWPSKAKRAMPPPLQDLSGQWQLHHRGLGHPSDQPSWRAPKHGLALPTANSELGSVIADENVLAVRDLTLPPYTQGPWSSVARNTSRLGLLSAGGAALYAERSRWSPVGFDREAHTTSGRSVRSSVRLPLKEAGVLFSVEVGPGADELPIDIEVVPEVRSFPASQINCSERQWRYPSNMQRNCWNWYAPRSFANESRDFTGVYTHHDAGHLIIYHDRMSAAVSAIAIKSEIAPERVTAASVSWRVPAGQSGTINFGVAFGERGDEAALATRAKHYVAKGKDANSTVGMEAAAADREDRFRSVFDPSSARYSGSLPLLQTEDIDLERVYYAGVVSMLELERTTEGALLPYAPPNTSRAYVTGAGSNASTNIFFWDTAYCVTALTLLDPQMVRNSLLQWMTPSLASEKLGGWGVDLYSGQAVGNHYAADDFTLFKTARYYLSLTGDFDFLDQQITAQSSTPDTFPSDDETFSHKSTAMTVLDALVGFATAYRNLTHTAIGRSGNLSFSPGLAANLLECVPTYQHRVASFNAASVWMLEQLAAILRERNHKGDAQRSDAYLAEAKKLAEGVLSLYRSGGFFSAMYPNGSKVAVRHVIDFVYVSEFMGHYLSQTMKREMIGFVTSELLTDTWMRALSPLDVAAKDSDRTDHGPYGAYDGWPALTVAAFARLGNHTEAARFLTSTAFVTQLGPYGQAHGVADPYLGTNQTYKPFEFTLSNAHGGTDFVDAILTAVFGLQASEAPALAKSSPPIADSHVPRGVAGSLRNVRWQGSLYDASAGAHGVSWKKNHF